MKFEVSRNSALSDTEFTVFCFFLYFQRFDARLSSISGAQESYTKAKCEWASKVGGVTENRDINYKNMKKLYFWLHWIKINRKWSRMDYVLYHRTEPPTEKWV